MIILSLRKLKYLNVHMNSMNIPVENASGVMFVDHRPIDKSSLQISMQKFYLS